MQRWLAFAILMAGGFLPPVDFFIVNVALPTIRDSLAATPAQTQLVISGYAAGYAVFLITGGRLGDLYGRRRCFLLGMVLFTLTNVLCGIAPNANLLLVGRVLQGLAAALLAPQVLGAVRALYADPRALSKALSIFGITMGLAAAVGQFSGGALVAWNPLDLGWRAIFLIKIPVCLPILLAAWRFLPETGGGQNTRLDLVGAGLISVALAAVVVPLSQGRELGWPLWVFVVLASAPCLIVVFLWHQDRLAKSGGMPLVDLRLFAIPSFRRGVLVATLFFFTTSFYFLFGIYQQAGLGVNPLWTGLAILPYGLGLFLGPIVSAPFQRLQPKLLAIGMSIQVTFYVLIGVLVAIGITDWRLSGVVFLAGLGQGVAFPRLYNTILGQVPSDQAGVASGITNSALQMGAAVSAAAIGSLFFSVLDGQTTERAYAHAFSIAQWTLSAALGIAMVLAIPVAIKKAR